MSFKCDSATYHGKPTAACIYVSIKLQSWMCSAWRLWPAFCCRPAAFTKNSKINQTQSLFLAIFELIIQSWASSSTEWESVCLVTKVNASQAEKNYSRTTTNKQIEEWRTSSWQLKPQKTAHMSLSCIFIAVWLIDIVSIQITNGMPLSHPTQIYMLSECVIEFNV